MVKKDVKRRIIEHFFVRPSDKLRVREIERVVKVPLPSVIRYCKELEEEGLLRSILVGSVKFYSANSGERYFFEKKLFNLRKIYESGIIDYLKEELSNPVVVLFGSFARGEDIEESDIDLYVESLSKKKIDVGKFEKILGREIEIFRHKNLKEITNPHLANNIVNGIVLNKQLEVFDEA